MRTAAPASHQVRSVEPSPVFVVGFMATGKSTAGRSLAARMGRVFVDLDEEIAAASGLTVPEIFRAEGEGGFRARERAALTAVLDRREVVVACGGGTPCFGDNLERMRAAGVVLALRASLGEIVRRADVLSRPLLAGAVDPLAAAEQLYRARAAVYEAADAVVDTDGVAPDDVAAELERRALLRLGALAVRLGARSYPVHVAPLASAGLLVRELCAGVTRVAILTDANVAAAGHAESVRAAIEASGIPTLVEVVPPGEGSKSLAEVGRVAAALVRKGLDRNSVLLAVGGGVVGDLGGFVASVLFRGIACAQVPTSLLAMIDSSVGGKTAVDLPEGKNLVGTFWQPRFVLADPATLSTLPARELAAAYGEALKIALLFDAELWERLERDPRSISAEELIVRCARWKAEVVSRDERETGGERVLLNLGHTIGHAIEAAGNGAVLHGEAVALGLVAAARVAVALGVADLGLEERVANAVRRAGLDADLEPWLRDDVLAWVGADKKRTGGRVRFIVPETPGRARSVELALAELTTLVTGR